MIRAACNLRGPLEVQDMLFGLARICSRQIRVHRLPRLYSAGVRYQSELPGRDVWQTALQTLQLKSGDCEDLVAYRVGELWVIGVDATPLVTRVSPVLLHCRVRWPDGRIECPSKVLGMGGFNA